MTTVKLQLPVARNNRGLRRFRFASALACLALLTACSDPNRNEPVVLDAEPLGASMRSYPNVLLISLDTVRADHLSCYGYSRPTTPNLDRLAAGSVQFANCRTQAPWTLPAHMSLLTSMLPAHNGVDNLNKTLPAKVMTLAEVLRESGYRTAALVNNGQMKAHWGFDRGFAEWREFEVDTPEGNCESITASALDWLRSTRDKSGGDDQSESADAAPFFLFLHYYDAHDPYAAPEQFRRQFGAKLTGETARSLAFAHREPGAPLDQASIDELRAAYDAELAWLDHELGRLLVAVPPETLVVVFSDHGEAFKEHDWLLHGATLYEEELRVPLIVKLPHAGEIGGEPNVVSEPVALLDVAPTILAACGIKPPLQFEGHDLAPLWSGKTLEPRYVLSETKAVLEGRLLMSAALDPLKGIYSLFDGKFQLFKLPDETTDLAAREPQAAEALFKPIAAQLARESFWMIHAAGQGDFEATIELAEGRFGLYIPAGLDPERDDFQVSPDGRTLRWHVYPGAATTDGKRGVKSLFVQPVDPNASLRVDFRMNGECSTKQVFLGPERTHPALLPAEVSATLPPISPIIKQPFQPTEDGFFVFLHRGQSPQPAAGQAASLDADTIRQLRSLGYLK